MSRSDDPSSRSVSRKKSIAASPEVRAPKGAKKPKAKKERAPILFDADFGVALAIMPAQRRPQDA